MRHISNIGEKLGGIFSKRVHKIICIVILLMVSLCVFKKSFIYKAYSQTLIYTQDFTSTFPPTGWQITNAGSGNNWTLYSATTYAYNGAYCMQYSYNISYAANTWAFMQGISMTAGNTYRVEFYQRVRSATYPEKMKVTVGNAQTVVSQTTTLLDLPSLTNTSYTNRITIDYIPTVSGTYYFAFNCYSAADKYVLYIDNIRVYETISCPLPGSLSVSDIQSTSASVSWSEPLPAPDNGYEYYLTENSNPPNGFTTPTGTVSAGFTSIDLNDLNEDTQYYFWIRSNCGSGDVSVWSAVVEFVTLPVPCTITNADFSGSSPEPYLDNGYYYFDLCQDDELTMFADITCTDCGTTNYKWIINAYDGNGETEYTSNPQSYIVSNASGYDVKLIVEGNNCQSSYNFRIRSSSGPAIEYISSSISGCAGAEIQISIGGEGNNIEVDPYAGEVSASLGVGETTFIPDGPSCTEQCYESSVTFTDFAPGATVESADDIRFLRINTEHTFVGDLQISLVGPDNCGSVIILQDQLTVASGGYDNYTYSWPWHIVLWYCYRKQGASYYYNFAGYGILENDEWTVGGKENATIFYTEAEAENAATNPAYSIAFTCEAPYTTGVVYSADVANIAFGVPNVGDFTGNSLPCDENQLYNSPGTGWDYCWSNNLSYSYAPSPNSFIYEDANVQPYQPEESEYSMLRVNPSDAENETNFYHPFQDFSNLIGCPLNGEWTVKVCDNWALDNGWIFEWELSLDPSLIPESWSYQTQIDYLTWDLGSDAVAEYISGGGTETLYYNLTPNPGLETGSYTGYFTVYDDFGCGADGELNYSVAGLSFIEGIAPGDYVWAGLQDTDWNANESNWYVKTGSGYDFAVSFPETSTNVYIVDFCNNNDVIVSVTSHCNNLKIMENKILSISGSTLNIAGNWDNQGAFNAGDGAVNFCGTSEQTINTVVSEGELFYDLLISKSPATLLTSFQNVNITNKLFFSSGILNSGLNTVTILSSAADAIVGGNIVGNDKFILGRLIRTIDGLTGYRFPIGYDTYGALGFDIEPEGVAGSQILGFLEPNSTPPLYDYAYCDLESDPESNGVEAGTGNQGYDGTNDRVSFNLESELQWEISNPGGGVNLYNITVYATGEQYLDPTITANGDTLRYLMKNGEPGNEGVVAGQSLPYFEDIGFIMCPTGTSLKGLTSFSHFNLIGAKTEDPVLTVELKSFTAQCDNGFAVIEWITASEANSDYFILERADEMFEFVEIDRIIAFGNSNQIREYSYIDSDLSDGNNYYRLKQVDFNGHVTSFGAIVLTCDEPVDIVEPVLVGYPNPFTNEFNILIENLKGEITIEIFDHLGTLVYSQIFVSESETFIASFYPDDLPPAVYNIRCRSDNFIQNLKLVKE
ncbi:MAG TPA: fibronectin type III domain-containing protein [Bacteroidales bacterium]|nr:fibronectin type III domain-containing protein [Bacteroidales bacterium]